MVDSTASDTRLSSFINQAVACHTLLMAGLNQTVDSRCKLNIKYAGILEYTHDSLKWPFQMHWGILSSCTDPLPVHSHPHFRLMLGFLSFLPSISHLCCPLIMPRVRECWWDQRTELHLNWKKCTRAAGAAEPNHVLRKSYACVFACERQIKALCCAAGISAILPERICLTFGKAIPSFYTRSQTLVLVCFSFHSHPRWFNVTQARCAHRTPPQKRYSSSCGEKSREADCSFESDLDVSWMNETWSVAAAAVNLYSPLGPLRKVMGEQIYWFLHTRLLFCHLDVLQTGAHNSRIKK